ncbi:hypothetical protein DB88DRAFT_508326 [Papiliotrema laurentii]|uniref:J domain-containing protein n=1 Tax=Papiliotrema laurentii TaxID=5418 RepID=A0AAD9FU81_PAPLA|nr:hypothetical protein DB88DRAFT_508326 [Papiliotrema laurentii]
MSALEHVVDPKSGRTVAVRENIDDHGFSVAAVPDGHWCSGIVLKDDARDLHDAVEAGSQDDKSIPPLFRNPSNPGGLDPVALMHDLRGHVFDEDRMPPFAKGYPLVSEAEQYKIVAKSRYYSWDDDHVVHFKTLRPAEVYAVPTYRIAYKLIYPGGQIAYWDGAFNPFRYRDVGAEGRESLFAFTLNDGFPKVNLYWPDLGERDPCTPAFVRYMDRNNLQLQDDALIQPIAGVGDVETMVEHITLFARATAQTPLHWQDPNILPADIEGRNDLRSLVKHAFARLMRIHTSVPPRFQAAMPHPSNTSQANTTTSEPRLASSPSLKRRVPKYQAAPKPPKTPPPRTSQWRPPPRPQALPKPTGPPVVVRDPLNYYAYLEIEPHSMFLDASKDAHSLARLSDAKRTMQMLYHPDRAYGGNAAKYHRRSQDINIAYDHLNTLAKRQAYQDV